MNNTSGKSNLFGRWGGRFRPPLPAAKGESPLSPLAIACVVIVCLAATALILLLPAESLAVDLVYQGF